MGNWDGVLLKKDNSLLLDKPSPTFCLTHKVIIANYKETQIENLHLGQEVAITVDAISGKEFKGKITAISGATGSKYSLVPTDNSAGNFVKIQQRIPVRIDFTDLSKEDNSSLAAGMMVIVKAKTKK